jgi:hypothetical protein
LLQAALGIGHTQAEPALKLELGAQSKGPRTLELHVVDPAGKPVADAQVAWLSDGLSRVDAASGKLFRCTDDEPARSDARGVVSLTRQTASLGWIYVCAPGYAPCCVIPLRGPLRAPTQRIELQPECTITGHLLPSDARMRIEGLTIVATSPRLPHPLLTSSAADGSFLLRGLPAGPVLIEAGIDDGWPGAARLNLDLAPAEHRRRDLLLSSERTIQGKVLDPFDRPRAGWTVTLEDTRGPARLLEGLLAPRPGVRRTTTDAEGCFSFEGCAAVEHLVCAHPPRAAQGPGGHARIGPSNETACVRVGTQPGARVHGTFVCSDPAAFPDPHMLLASRMLEQVEVVSVDARTGYFEFAGLPEGEYVLGTLAPSRGIVHLQEFQLLPDSDLDLGRVAAPLSGKLRVLVHDPSGALLESVLVQLAPGGSAGAVKPGRQWTRQLLDAEGGFTREGILPGPYHLLVEWPGSGNLHKPVEVRAGETTVVELP